MFAVSNNKIVGHTEEPLHFVLDQKTVRLDHRQVLGCCSDSPPRRQGMSQTIGSLSLVFDLEVEWYGNHWTTGL